MKVNWYGHSCFEIFADDLRIIHDPYKDMLAYKMPKGLTADIVMSSHDHDDHNHIKAIDGKFAWFYQIGDYKYKERYFHSIKTYHDKEQGKVRGENLVFKYTLEDITIAHLGDLGHVLTSEQVEELKDVDVLFIPCGGGYTIGVKDALVVIDQIKPKVIIPMHYRTKAMGPLGLKFEKVGKLIDKLEKTRYFEKVDTLELTRESIDKQDAVYVLNYAAHKNK